MKTETRVEITPPQDTMRIINNSDNTYEILIRRDTYQSSATLVFPDFTSMARVIDDLAADLDNLRTSEE